MLLLPANAEICDFAIDVSVQRQRSYQQVAALEVPGVVNNSGKTAGGSPVYNGHLDSIHLKFVQVDHALASVLGYSKN